MTTLSSGLLVPHPFAIRTTRRTTGQMPGRCGRFCRRRESADVSWTGTAEMPMEKLHREGLLRGRPAAGAGRLPVPHRGLRMAAHAWSKIPTASARSSADFDLHLHSEGKL